MKALSRELRSVAPRDVRQFVPATDAADILAQVQALCTADNLAKIGIGLDSGMLRRMMQAANDMPALFATAAMDSALQPLVTTASITTPIQFLQSWLPGFVAIITAARKADEILGIVTAGAWEDEELVQGTLEGTANGAIYGDYTNVPLASWNVTYESRTIVRYEQGMRAGVLEEARAGKVNINSAETKRNASTEQLEIFRNTVAFFGFNSGNGRTYGYLNDPNLPAAVPFPATGTGSSTAWADKNFAQIQADIRLMVSTLRSQSQDTIDPETVPLTLVLPTDVVDYLTTTTDQGVSVRAWMAEAYPKIRVVSAPQMELAIGGENAAYLQAETVNDGISTDDKRVWIQGVPAKFKLVGVSQQTKGYEEDYSNATAGAYLKRGYAMVRFYGC